MNSEVALKRRHDLLAVDAVNTSNNDFLMTHVPMNRIVPLKQFEIVPKTDRQIDEETVFSEFACNPENLHQLVVIYGESGTGKSHFIRWLKNRVEAQHADNEVIVFIRRENNTLNSTIQQLLQLPEVQELNDIERYKKLSHVVDIRDNEKLRSEILNSLAVEIGFQNDPDLSLFKKKDNTRISSFLKSEVVLKYLEKPVDRIISKIIPTDLPVDRDLVAEFKPEDFDFATYDLTESQISSMEAYARKLAHQLQNDDSGELKTKLATYLNSFVEKAIQKSTGITPADLKNLFLQIRKELKKKGKNLTLFVEDITSFTGIDEGLLDALAVQHTGEGNENVYCRLSSFIGTTSSYLNTYVRKNYSDRVSQYFYLPKGILDSESLELFFGKYLNAISLSRSEVDEWARIRPITNDSFPVAADTEGKNWPHVSVGTDISLSLYPFTRSAIRNLYSRLQDKTPRYILQQLIEPVVSNVLNDKAHFPKQMNLMAIPPITMVEALHGQFGDQEEQSRVERLLTNWGNGKPEIEILPSGKKMISGIPEELLKEFGIPELSLNMKAVPSSHSSKKSEDAQTLPQSSRNVQITTEKQVYGSDSPQSSLIVESDDQSDKAYTDKKIKDEDQKKLEEVLARLRRWYKGETMDLSSTVSVEGKIKDSLKFLSEFILKTINWAQNGISQAELDQFRNQQLITLEGSKKGRLKKAPIILRTGNTGDYRVIEAAVRIKLLGKNTSAFDYPGALQDIHQLTKWINLNEKRIIRQLSRASEKAADDQVSETISVLLLSRIAAGEFKKVSDLKKMDLTSLLSSKESLIKKLVQTTEIKRDDKWKAFIVRLNKELTDQPKALKELFNLPQGVAVYSPKGSGPVVLDAPNYRKFAEMCRKNLTARIKETETSQQNLGESDDLVCMLKNAVDKELERQENELRKFKNVLPLSEKIQIRKIPIAVKKLIKAFEQNQSRAKSSFSEDNRKELERLLAKYKEHVEAIEKVKKTTDYVEKASILNSLSTEYLTQLDGLFQKISSFVRQCERIIDQELQNKKMTIDELDQISDYHFDPEPSRQSLNKVRVMTAKLNMRFRYDS